MYQTINETTVQRLADGAFIPADPANADYRTHLDWRAEGNEPLPAPSPPPSPVPSTISRRQCARAMLSRSLISGTEALAMTQTGAMPAMVSALVTGAPDETLIRIDFAADTYERGNPLLNQLMTGAGYGAAEIDDFFREAAGL
jgi:hypothetical protein